MLYDAVPRSTGIMQVTVPTLGYGLTDPETRRFRVILSQDHQYDTLLYTSTILFYIPVRYSSIYCSITSQASRKKKQTLARVSPQSDAPSYRHNTARRTVSTPRPTANLSLHLAPFGPPGLFALSGLQHHRPSTSSSQSRLLEALRQQGSPVP
jgi:hypothetical protein